ncbi:hypothetical protein ACGF07_04010 [Kitasatospora sp. NPDC048194]|uniref:hypothetical protein n=1 Tax=Kitasatospora sp. NPDC048194 TaxID=3364045 RepID=UPI00371957D9
MATLVSAAALAVCVSAPVHAAPPADAQGSLTYYYKEDGLPYNGSLDEPELGVCHNIFAADFTAQAYAPHNLTNAIAEVFPNRDCTGLPTLLLPDSPQRPDTLKFRSAKFRL